MLYLLQLVQALKFESTASDQRSSRSTTNAISYDDSGLSDFLIARGVTNHVLGNRLYWYLMVEVALEDRMMAKMYGRVVFKFLSKILEVRISLFSWLADIHARFSRKVVVNGASSCEDKGSWSRHWRNVQETSGPQKILGQKRSKSCGRS